MQGDTGERKLDTSADNFERGGTDVFVFEAPDLGAVLRVLIGHDNKGMGPGWKLGDVTVEVAPDTHRSPYYTPHVKSSLVHTARHVIHRMLNYYFFI